MVDLQPGKGNSILDTDVLLTATAIFFLRVLGNMLTTFRLVLIVRGQKISSTILAALEALIFALALGSVVSDLSNVWNLLAYCVGFAIGGYLGLVLEQRFITRYVAVQVISPIYSHEIALAIREVGYGATEGWGQGASGTVGSVTAVVMHRQVDHLLTVVHKVDPDAFVTMEELRGISRGHMRRLARPER